MWYSADNIKPSENIDQYILDHLDEALERDYIKVYVQPVVRTLTRECYGMETLARWDDPEYGLLEPELFVSILEKHRQIHKLDIRMLHKVCKMIKDMSSDIHVPVSINFSRLDYELCDLFETVESAVLSNKVPRSSLCIEITESAFSKDEEMMHQYIDRFRKVGYSVWMDDFGSGYSSLNVLKDFSFDELKIDMHFLSDFSNRSRKILAAIVNMAKDIGIQTLAEGVETEEQFEFLRNIGCEKAQGFLFGKPMPLEKCLKHTRETGLTWESPQFHWYYDDIGQINVLSARPFHKGLENDTPIRGNELNSISIAIVELQGDMAKMLFANQAFKNIASAVNWPFPGNHPPAPSVIPLSHISQRLRQLFEEACKKGKGKLFSVYDNDYYEMRAKRLACHGGSYAIMTSVTNLSQLSAMANQQQLDEGLRSLYSVYEQVLLHNLNDLTVVSLYMDRASGHKLPTGSLNSRLEKYIEHQIYPDDRDRFIQFINLGTLEKRAVKEGVISIHLRVLSLDGSYNWKCQLLVRIRKNIYYLLIRDAEKEVREFQSRYQFTQTAQASDETLTPDLLWNNIVNHAELKFFWKDTERRFVGASRSFLKHYHFNSMENIVGKTDEDMGWHIHNDPYRDEEWKVLHDGITSRQVKGNCLVQGENHEIIATKMPLFNNDGKIVGLIGQFSQTDSYPSIEDAVKQVRSDNLSGLLNSRGLYEDLFTYIDEYELRGRDFALIEISIDDFKDISSRFDYDFGNSVIREIGRKLLVCCENTATIGRVTGGVFTVLRQFETVAELDNLIASIRHISMEPCQVAEAAISVYLSVGMALYSETRNYASMEAQAEMRRMTDNVENLSQNQLIENTGQIFHMFDELPLAYAVYKIIQGPEGGDAIILYANRRFTQKTRYDLKELIGKRVSTFFPLDANDWFPLAEKAGMEGKTVNGIFREVLSGYDIEISAYPVIGPGFCAFTFWLKEKKA